MDVAKLKQDRWMLLRLESEALRRNLIQSSLRERLKSNEVSDNFFILRILGIFLTLNFFSDILLSIFLSSTIPRIFLHRRPTGIGITLHSQRRIGFRFLRLLSHFLQVRNFPLF